MPAIDISNTWDYVSHETSPIIAIIDTGIQLDHPELYPSLWVNTAEIPDNKIDDDNNGYTDDIHGWNFYSNSNSINDDNNHGTHIAGIISAEQQNNQGIVGLTKGCKIMVLKAANKYGNLTSLSVAQAIQYAINHKASIINLSFGAQKSQVIDEYLIETQIQYANQQNISVVAAAGNQSIDITKTQYIPATYPDVITVSSIDSTLAFAKEYSNYGNHITIAAPGSNIISTVSQSGYKTFSGTSMAAPHVSATLAILKQALPNQNHETYKKALYQTETNNIFTGYGHLNVHQSLQRLDTTPPTITHQTTSFQEKNDIIIITANIQDNTLINKYPSLTLYYQFDYIDNSTSDWLQVTCNNNISEAICTIIPPDPPLSMHYYFQATDYSQNTTTLPSNEGHYTIHFTDTTGPIIYINQKVSSKTDLLNYSLSDTSPINTKSLLITITTADQSYSLTAESEAVIITQTKLTIDLSLIELSTSDQCVIDIKLSDEKNNISFLEHHLTLETPLFSTLPNSTKQGFIIGPTPIKNQACIQYTLSTQATVHITIFAINGKKVWETIIDENYHPQSLPGTHSIIWDTQTQNHIPTPNGPYLVIMQLKNGDRIKRYKKRALILR